MPRLLQINVCSAMLSTGKIAEDIAKVAQNKGWETYIAYGRMSRPSISHEIKIGTKTGVLAHYAYNKLFDGEGMGSTLATRMLVRKIKEIKPDVVHLHNIHDHYLNYPILLQYLKEEGIPTVWTQHDCWSFTGGCMYYDQVRDSNRADISERNATAEEGCMRWKNECHDCPNKRGLIRDYSRQQHALRKALLKGFENLTLVPVSDWLADSIKESFLSDKKIVTIHNGIDTKIFRPVDEYRKPKETAIEKRYDILGVAGVWDERKGLGDFLRLRNELPENYSITLVGLSESQKASLPDGIKAISRTTDTEELVRLYNEADVFVNPTYSDNFPTTNIEALACGTPVVTYRTGGSPEAIDENTGTVVEKGDLAALAASIRMIAESHEAENTRKECRQRAEALFDKDKNFSKYIEIYEHIRR